MTIDTKYVFLQILIRFFPEKYVILTSKIQIVQPNVTFINFGFT